MYKTWHSIYCPVMDEIVYFTSKGFNHLLSKPNRSKRRKLSEQYMKLMCLDYAPTVISQSKTIRSVRVIKKTIESKQKDITLFAISYEIAEGKSIRVILERLGSGKLHFLSIMPDSKRSKHKKAQ